MSRCALHGRVLVEEKMASRKKTWPELVALWPSEDD